jgi:hypothetical protein
MRGIRGGVELDLEKAHPGRLGVESGLLFTLGLRGRDGAYLDP